MVGKKQERHAPTKSSTERTQSKHWTQTIFKLLVSFFIVLNLFTVLFMNRPPSLIAATDGILSSLSPRHAQGWKSAGWCIKRYAHLVGLDNRWEMFGRQSRFNWMYVIQARYAGSDELVVLPLPRQSKRTFWQRALFDFKEAKFHLNIYNSIADKKAYSRYLCRQYPTYKGAPIEWIVYEMRYQNIYDRKEAARRGRHHDPVMHRKIIDAFKSPGLEDRQ